MKYVIYSWVIISKLLFRVMKKRKIYLSFFYGSKQELTKAFTKITDGDFVRYIMTTETLICRFKSNKKVSEIMDILRQYCPDVPFFIFPISNTHWKYNLPLDVENNLLTDNPIITTPQNQAINQYFMAVINELKKTQPGILDEQSPDFIDSAINQLNLRLQQAVQEDRLEVAAQIRDRIKELRNQKENLDNPPLDINN